MRDWSSEFKEWYDIVLPVDYLVFDMETTGLFIDNPDHPPDLPVDIGHCIVRDKEIINQGGFILNWVDYPGIDLDWLESRFVFLRKRFAEQGKTYHYSIERLQEEGKDPDKVLWFYRQLFEKNRAAKAAFVGHNAISFDAPMFNQALNEILGLGWEFRDDELFDTGIMEKALRAEMFPCLDDETLRGFFVRVRNARRKGIMWKIEVCIERYDLANRFNLDLSTLHGAEADCVVCHHLFEEHRLG